MHTLFLKGRITGEIFFLENTGTCIIFQGKAQADVLGSGEGDHCGYAANIVQCSAEHCGYAANLLGAELCRCC